ncbi:class I SAM-dependent methyltransferase [Aeoliella sp. ICT_H6.2]|uniref:Class I SAM-dependent methyltransferase n=1 Tax=Aeoliella straminimaris TaxID=2954799 RepID=A0A9X2FGI7_9BACT|nr:class I SAM-dependent methyltransferase [Aeoliella straminimaris]MCO6045246.1 class I SAM-dependent methyltransferase [Aeoliella straminimaris]
MIENTKNWLKNYRRRQHEMRRSKARIELLRPLLPRDGVAAELGVFEGLFSELLMEHMRPQRLHLIDPWFQLSGIWDWASGKPSTVDAVRRILKRWQKEIENGTVRVHIDDDTLILPRFDDAYFDWVYIDSSHQYEHTKRELDLLVSKMKPTGVIAGDDWRPDPNHRHHGVCVAVREFVEASDYELILQDEPTAQWALQLKST